MILQNVQGFLILNIYALLIIIITSIVFFKKDRQKEIEDRVYAAFLVVTTVVSISGILLGIMVMPTLAINELIIKSINKIYLIFLMLWIAILTYYTLNVSVINTEKIPKFKRIFTILMYFCIFIIVLLPLKVEMGEQGTVAMGLSVYFTYLMFALGFICQIFCVILDVKHLQNKKYIPIYMLAFFGITVLVLQVLFPNLNYLINPVLVLITVIMFHTIENPDMKALEEIHKSKELAEHANMEKSMFLYNTSQELKSPVNAIIQKCNALLDEQDIIQIKEGLKEINFVSKRLSSTISGTLDMSKSKISNIEVKNTKYDIKLLLQELTKIFSLSINEKNIEFRVNFDDSIPSLLLGDSLRIKQILTIIMNTAISHTEKGFIEFNATSVIKHNICRLIISIEDSGKGIEAKKLESLFYNTEYDDSISEDKLKNVQNTKESLSVIKVLTNLIGGTVIANSELGKGSKFTVVLDQKIYQDEEASFPEGNKHQKKVLIVDDDLERLKSLEKIFGQFDIDVNLSKSGMECLEKIRLDSKYDLIILDEGISKMTSSQVLEKLRLEEEFDVPVIIMIDQNNAENKDNYIYTGFSGCIVKPLTKESISKLLEKHTNKM